MEEEKEGAPSGFVTMVSGDTWDTHIASHHAFFGNQTICRNTHHIKYHTAHGVHLHTPAFTQIKVENSVANTTT